MAKPVTGICSVKMIFLKILWNSQRNNCARVSFLIKLQVKGPATLSEKIFGKGIFPLILWNF